MFWVVMTILMLACLAFLILEYRRLKQGQALTANFRRLFWTYSVTLALFLIVGLPLANYEPEPIVPDPEDATLEELKDMRREIQDNFKKMEDLLQSKAGQ